MKTENNQHFQEKTTMTEDMHVSTAFRSFSPVPFWADACITINRVSALRSIFTFVVLAVIKVNITVFTYISRCAITPVKQESKSDSTVPFNNPVLL